MSVNRHQPHVLVLPEDDANRQLANGFYLQIALHQQRQMQVLRVAGGWNEVLNLFNSEHATEMDRYPLRHMVLLLDFDEDQRRLERAKARIPDRLAQRVFILGSSREPEALKRAGLGTYEQIGSALAEDCSRGTDSMWSHALLQNNAEELDRLSVVVKPILFA
jgi:hypothetical protein